MSLLEVKSLSRTFGTLQALNRVDFEVEPGEVLGLAGQSGAGKSVLTQILAGLDDATSGEVWFNGKKLIYPWSPRPLGIEIIHQEPELALQLDVTSNIFLGEERNWWGIPNQTRMVREASQIFAALGVTNPPYLQEKVINLPSEMRQLLAIARVMTTKPKLVVIDDPTALLSIRYQQKLLELILQWRNADAAVIFASNNLDHLFSTTDRILILRDGAVIGHRRTDSTSRETLVNDIVGKHSDKQLSPALWALERYYRARAQAEKLQEQQSLLTRDLQAQGNLNQQLVEELAIQVRALDQANIALQDANRRLMTERELERKRLARELHDQVIQDLLSTNYQLEELARESSPQLEDALSDVRQNIRELVDDVRRICGDLRPPTIDSLGLGAAIKSFARDWSERTGIEAELYISKQLGRLPEEIELSVFRIIQEGLNNIWRHSDAGKAEISVDRTSPRTLVLSISDNGAGLPHHFDLANLAKNGHYGLLGISERVALLGGRLHLQNRQESGTILQVEIPHPRAGIKKKQT